MVEKLMIFCLTASSNYSTKALQDRFECNSLAELWFAQPLPSQQKQKAAKRAGWFGWGCVPASLGGLTVLFPYPQGLVLAWHHHISHSMRKHFYQALADKNPHSFLIVISPAFPWNYHASRIGSWLANMLQHMHLGYNFYWAWWLHVLCLGRNYCILWKFPFYFFHAGHFLCYTFHFLKGLKRSRNAVSGQFILIWTKKDFQL